jgi:hypothetical protein
MILLFGGAATLAIALIGSGLAGLRKLSNSAPQPPSDS